MYDKDSSENNYPLAESSTLTARSGELQQKFFEERRKLWSVSEGEMTMNHVGDFINAGLENAKAHHTIMMQPGKSELAKTYGPLNEAQHWQTTNEAYEEVLKWQKANDAIDGKGPITDALSVLGRLEDEQRRMWEAALEDTSLAETWLKPHALEAKTEILDFTTGAFRRAQQVVINTWSLNMSTTVSNEDLLSGYKPLANELTNGDVERAKLASEELAQSLLDQLQKKGAKDEAELFGVLYRKLEEVPNGLNTLARAMCVRARESTDEESDEMIRPVFDNPKKVFEEVLTIPHMLS